MDIKGEANVFKAEVAKNLKQLSENVEVVIGKKIENNAIEIKIEDKSKHSTVNLNFVLIGSVPPNQIDDIAKRVKSILNEQADIVKSSGDEVFESYASHDTPPSIVVTGTTNALIVENRDHLLEGKTKPKFIKSFKNLPSSVNVFNPIIPSNNT